MIALSFREGVRFSVVGSEENVVSLGSLFFPHTTGTCRNTSRYTDLIKCQPIIE